jgi:hypothetical protein
VAASLPPQAHPATLFGIKQFQHQQKAEKIAMTSGRAKPSLRSRLSTGSNGQLCFLPAVQSQLVFWAVTFFAPRITRILWLGLFAVKRA